MVERADRGAQPPDGGAAAVLFTGDIATEFAQLADTYGPALREMAGLLDRTTARSGLERIADMLADPATARDLTFFAATVHLVVLPRSIPGYPLYRKVFAAFAERAEGLAFRAHCAAVDSGQVSAALRILAVRAPAAYSALVEALAADPSVEVTAR
ncbi:hypothetical protein [Amycolatopsis sp. Poz14]|uniref:hypothetical protein n=1 Tax=Amycolatopsis sp. Poz14 TaxID=1447705 RepID=UPI001EE9544B|nr:hypothetical protein [Amycolatopsis sp. Poz14]MCG3748895.1 hypothetical protein [Amycolatopsis sp. Poz14]